MLIQQLTVLIMPNYLEYFSKDTGVCTCCADSIKGQLNRVLSYKYPTNVNTLYKKDFKRNTSTGFLTKAEPFVIENEKRNVKIRFDPPSNLQST